ALAQLADGLADAEPLTQIQPPTRRRPVDVAAQSDDAEDDGEPGAVETEFATTDDTGPVPAAGEMPADDVTADEVAVDDDVTAPHPPVAPN
ncbi:hypothetical protein, partial [Kribbia dieselivorans]|uniref:hypothetical protein n=1 Tax=Kribbia dieselivorans TaxID=331526 RepID=UPI0014700D66